MTCFFIRVGIWNTKGPRSLAGIYAEGSQGPGRGRPWYSLAFFLVFFHKFGSQCWLKKHADAENKSQDNEDPAADGHTADPEQVH